KVTQLVTSDLLVSKGCETTICENGQEAIEKLESNAFDIVLMDMQMPVMDGYTAMRIIRSNTESNYSKIPIIALTAHVFSGELEKCIQAGATDYLSKPFEPKELFGMIWKLAKDSKTNDSNESGNTIPQNNSTNNQQGNSTSNTSISNDGNIHFTGIKSIEHPDLNESKKDDFNNHTLVDFKRLKEFLNGNDTILTSTLKAIKETFQECLSDLHKIAKEEDNDNLKRVIHKLKPNLEMIGSIYLHETSLRLEKSSLNGEQGREDLDTVIRGMKRILVIIDDYLLDQLHVY
ncbi:MAG: response regulator, partial [Crocinitomicaceae bacterium]